MIFPETLLLSPTIFWILICRRPTENLSKYIDVLPLTEEHEKAYLAYKAYFSIKRNIEFLDKETVLSKISGLFSRRGFNIDSLAVGVTQDPSVSRITIVANGDPKTFLAFSGVLILPSAMTGCLTEARI